jgi:hypothetical protein
MPVFSDMKLCVCDSNIRDCTLPDKSYCIYDSYSIKYDSSIFKCTIKNPLSLTNFLFNLQYLGKAELGTDKKYFNRQSTYADT